jgi:hypothetical protein
MKKRTFLKLSLPACLLAMGCCGRDHPIATREFKKLQDDWLEAYNIGCLCKAETFFDSKCTFASDSITGGSERLARMLRVMHRRYEKRGRLPLSFQTITIEAAAEMSWSLTKVRGATEKKELGILTLAASRSESGLRIVHYHFSR